MSISYSHLDEVKEVSTEKCSRCENYMHHATYECSEEYQTWIEKGYHCIYCGKDN